MDRLLIGLAAVGLIAGCSNRAPEGIDSGDVRIYLAGVFTYSRQLEESRVDDGIDEIGTDGQHLITFSRPYSDVDWGPQAVKGYCSQFMRVGPGAGALSATSVPDKLRDKLQAGGEWPQYAN